MDIDASHDDDLALSQQLFRVSHSEIPFNTDTAVKVKVDMIDFRTLLAACEAHPHSDLASCEHCLAQLAQAADLYLASVGIDHVVRIWEVSSGQQLYSFPVRQHVYAIAFSPDGRMIVTAAQDGAARLWDIATGERVQALRPPRLYESMNITGVTGITKAQKAALKARGRWRRINTNCRSRTRSKQAVSLSRFTIYRPTRRPYLPTSKSWAMATRM